MSKMFQRLNTTKEVFSFEIYVHHIIIALPHETHLKIIWKKKDITSETKVFTVTPEEKKAAINEQLLMPVNTLFKKKGTGAYNSKEAELKIIGEANGKYFEAGKVLLNLADYIGSSIRESNYPIQKSKDKEAEVCLSIKAQPLENQNIAAEAEVEDKKDQKIDDKIEEKDEESKGEESPLYGHTIEELQQYKEKLEKNLAKIEEAKRENQELKEKLGEIESKNNNSQEELEEKLAKTKKKCKELKSGVGQLKDTKEELEAFISKEKIEIEKIKEENEEKSRENDDIAQLESKLQKVEQEVNKLKESVSTKGEILQSLETSYKMLVERNETLAKELFRLQKLEEEYNDKEPGEEESQAKLEEQINGLNERMQNLLRRHSEKR
ncbi:unnamed protein product [Blepharisma stoltei]|uniref:C2 NT-type domain-containing protein n=1 Tax=Blepharisma stoltei TaxID=1481888 RepID=A0AAU9JDJ3_9CILI|nr:unnamed protein product [Blepharisma stoltei]